MAPRFGLADVQEARFASKPLGSEQSGLKEWDAVRVAPGTMRCFEAGEEGLDVLAFGARGLGIGDTESELGWWSD